jgi:short-subunit dehydrogenase
MNIIITGASKGIGLETVLNLAVTGNHSIIGIARNKQALSELENRFSEKIFRGIVFDLTTIFTHGNELISNIKQTMPEVNILINNAGGLVNKTFENFTQPEIEKLFSVNVIAPAELIRLLSPLMGLTQKAHVVNIGSMAGFQGSSKFAGLSWYSASKAAIMSLTECLAEENKNRNVAYNCLALGAVQTEMLAQAFPGYKAPVNAHEMGKYIANFALTAHTVMNGRVVSVSTSNPE